MSEYPVILIKPDAIRDVLDQLIISDLQRQIPALRIIWQKFWVFSPRDLTLIYPSWTNHPMFPYMVGNLTSGPSRVVLAKGPPGTYESVAGAKGKMNIGGGIRSKYRIHDIHALQCAGLSESELNCFRAENRMHSTDALHESATLIRVCGRKSEMEEIAIVAPEVFLTMKLGSGENRLLPRAY